MQKWKLAKYWNWRPCSKKVMVEILVIGLRSVPATTEEPKRVTKTDIMHSLPFDISVFIVFSIQDVDLLHVNIKMVFFAVLPAAFFTSKLTVYFPVLLYLCTGFWSVEVLWSPKFQDQEVGDPVLLSVNFTVKSDFPELDAEKAAIGDFKAFTVIWLDFVTVLLPAEFSTFKLTVYFPALLYVCVGFLVVEPFPSPKLHLQVVSEPILLSTNCTFNGALPEVTLLMKLATGDYWGMTKI